MITCTGCGAAVELDANFCSKCGASLQPANASDSTWVIRGAPESPPPPEELTADEVAAIEALPLDSCLLIARRGAHRGARFLCDTDITTVGRHPDSSIFLDDVTVSRHHAQIVRGEDGWYVVDNGSLNGTYVNRTLVDGKALLRQGDEIQIGKFRVAFFVSGFGLR